MPAMTHPSMTPPTRSGLFRMTLSVICAATLGAAACRVSSTEEGESSTRWGVTDTATEVRRGIELTATYESSSVRFAGTVRNTTNETVGQVGVEIHLSNGVELGPTPRVEIAPGGNNAFELDARGQNFDWWSVHVEIGSDSG